MSAASRLRIGWIGTGRMGLPLAHRLLDAGLDLTVWNRTAAKAEPLVARGATLAHDLTELAGLDIVFTMLATSQDFEEVTIGAAGLLTAGDRVPDVLVDCSTVSVEASRVVRAVGDSRGTQVLAAPISGNPQVVSAGRATLVVSGPRSAFERARPALESLGRSVTYVGRDDVARTVKIAHNVMLGIVTQALAEVLVLLGTAGVERGPFLAFLNESVMGSAFTRYKTPALVTLDFSPTFTPELLRKDLDLGLDMARESDCPMPLTRATRDRVQALVEGPFHNLDFAALLMVQAASAGLELTAEAVPGPQDA